MNHTFRKRQIRYERKQGAKKEIPQNALPKGDAEYKEASLVLMLMKYIKELLQQ